MTTIPIPTTKSESDQYFNQSAQLNRRFNFFIYLLFDVCFPLIWLFIEILNLMHYMGFFRNRSLMNSLCVCGGGGWEEHQG